MNQEHKYARYRKRNKAIAVAISRQQEDSSPAMIVLGGFMLLSLLLLLGAGRLIGP